MSIHSSCGICCWRRVRYRDGGRELGGKDDGRVERDEDEQVDDDGVVLRLEIRAWFMRQPRRTLYWRRVRR